MIEGWCEHALLPSGWHSGVRLRAGADGRWQEVVAGLPREGLPLLGRYLLPGMPNLHSHAFQRAMAGRAERYGRPDDSFWTWREEMYRHAGRISPEQLHVIARWLYAELVESGYTRVAEFHYLHHGPDGHPYAPPTAMADALVAAAADAGIGLTLLPVLYQRGGFREEPLAERQRRFAFATEDFLEFLAGLDGRAGIRVGCAIHSLRAVGDMALARLLGDPLIASTRRPIHIHIAEQRAEVEACLAVHGRRPIERLFDLARVDRRWCLVHATHLDDAELAQVAASGAVVGLCPTTEANLGDGLFPLAALRRAGGAWGIGSDSHVGIDPREELRWLEYQARLGSLGRTVLADGGRPEVAVNLWGEAVAGGARALGADTAGLVVGADADWLVLEEDDPVLAAASPESALSAWMFAGARCRLREVGVAGRVVADAGGHPARERWALDYRRVMAELHA
jgi:formimidoylglutamate deiminase